MQHISMSGSVTCSLRLLFCKAIRFSAYDQLQSTVYNYVITLACKQHPLLSHNRSA